MTEDLIGRLCALLTAVTWAAAMVMFKHCGERITPLALNLYKNTLGLVLLVLTAIIAGGSFQELSGHSAREIAILLISGFIGIALADTIFLYALNLVGVGIQSIVDCLYSPMVLLFSWLWLSEALGLPDYLGAGLVVSGVFLATRHKPPANRTSAQILAGVLVGMVAIALIAIAIIMAKPTLEGFPLLHATILRLLAGTLPLAVWALFGRRREVWTVFRPTRQWVLLVPASILGSYLSMILWIAGFKYTLAGIAGVLNQTSSIFAITLAALFLKEPLTRRKLISMALAFAGVILVSA